MTTANDHQIPKYSRIRGDLNATFTKATTFKVVDASGFIETYTVETGRDEQGDHVFIECLSEDLHSGATVTRMYFPPKVVKAILRQRDALSTRLKRSQAKRIAKERIAAGIVPFQKKQEVGA